MPSRCFRIRMRPRFSEDGMAQIGQFFRDAAAGAPITLDPRLPAFRADLADARLRGRVEAPRFVEGVPARVVVGRAPVRKSPAPDAELLTFYHYGEPVLVFETGEGFAWCQSFIDDYVGYVALAATAPIEAALEPTHYVKNLGAYTYGEP